MDARTLGLCSILVACSSSAADGGASITGTWKLTQGSAAVYLDLREDKSCRYATSAAGAVTCAVCTYTFGDGTLTLSFAGPPAQTNSSKATLGAETLDLDASGTKQSYARATLPADVASVCK